MKPNKHEANYFYDKGFRDGYATGMARGLKVAIEIIESRPDQNISIEFKDEKTAEKFMKEF